jgi:hypothetical protein
MLRLTHTMLQSEKIGEGNFGHGVKMVQSFQEDVIHHHHHHHVEVQKARAPIFMAQKVGITNLT